MVSGVPPEPPRLDISNRANIGMVYSRMKRVKYALRRFWTRARGLVGRKRGGDGGGERSKDPSGVVLWRLIPLAAALAAAGVVL